MTARKPAKRPPKKAIKAARAKKKQEAPAEPPALLRTAHSYEPEFAARAAELCTAGASIEVLAHEFQVKRRTILMWRSHYSEFADAMRLGWEAFDQHVERSLAERAMGYDVDEPQLVRGPDGSHEIVMLPRHVPADVNAAKFWLANRRGQQWANTSKQELSGPGGGPIEVESKLSTLEVVRRIAYLFTLAKHELADQEKAAAPPSKRLEGGDD